MRELDRFIAASDTRLQKREAFRLRLSQPEKDDANKKSAEDSMERSLTALLEPELLALLKPRYQGAVTGDRGRIYFSVEARAFYIICDPFLKGGDVQAGWFGVIRHGANEQLAVLQFRGDSFQDDLLQGIRHAR